MPDTVIDVPLTPPARLHHAGAGERGAGLPARGLEETLG